MTAGIRRAETARQWANAGLAPEVAGPWYDLDVRGPDEALLWLAAGFDPKTAGPWIHSQVDPQDARSWVTTGWSLSDFHSVSVNTTIDLQRFAHELTAATLTFNEIKPFLDRNVEPFRSLRWAKWCRTNSSDTAYQWSGADFDPDEAMQWIDEGFVEPRDAQIWRQQGHRPHDASVWIALGVTNPQDMSKWETVTHNRSEIAAWTAIGVTNPEIVQELKLQKIDVARAKGFRALGARTHDLIFISSAHVPVDGLEKWLGDGRTVRAFFSWTCDGFSPQEAAKWQDAGYTDPHVAKQWRAEGVGPLESIAWTNAGFENAPAAGQWHRDEIRPHDAKLLTAAGVSEPHKALAWTEHGFTPGEIGEWRSAGVKGPDTALTWTAQNFASAEAAPWIRLDINAKNASALRNQGIEIPYVQRWTTETGFGANTLSAWLARDFDIDTAITLRQNGFSMPEIFDALNGWTTHGFTSAETVEWSSVGAKGPVSALTWVDQNFASAEAAPWIHLGLDANNASALRDRGIEAPYAKRWITETGFGADTLTDWLTKELDIEAAIALRQNGLPKEELKTWVDSGIDFSEAIERWSAEGFDIADASKWMTAGIRRAATARQWANAGLAPEVAGPWYDLDVRGPDEALLWLAAGFEPKTAGPWIPSQVDPQDARVCVTAGLSPTNFRSVSVEETIVILRFAHDLTAAKLTYGEIQPFLDRNVEPFRSLRWAEWCRTNSSDTAYRWSAVGFEPDEAMQWIDEGFDEPHATQIWRQQGHRPSESAAWVALGVTNPQVVHELKLQNIDVVRARGFRALGASPDDLNFIGATRVPVAGLEEWLGDGRTVRAFFDWARNEFSPHEAARWQDAGYTDPHDAEIWRRQGHRPDDVAEWLALGVTNPEIARQLKLQNIDVARAKGFRALGAGPNDLTFISTTRAPVAGLEEWLGDGRTVRAFFRWTQNGFSPQEAAQWQDAGYTDPHVARSSGAARPTAELRRQPKPAQRPAIDRFDEWLKAGEKWIAACVSDRSQYRDFFRMIFDEGFKWADPGENLLGVSTSHEWLGEVTERAIEVSESLQKDPHWPKVIELEEITIILDGATTHPLAWVGDKNRGGLVCFSSSTYDVRTAATNDSWRYMAGIAISWFIDCCIVIRLNKSSLPFDVKKRPSSRGSRLNRAAARYMPRPIFDKQYEAVRSGTQPSPRAHLVDGFVRTFEDGQKPTDEARSRAPARIQSSLRPNQTWVRPHKRGAEHSKELRTYLSTYSALADAMAFADQDNHK